MAGFDTIRSNTPNDQLIKTALQAYFENPLLLVRDQQVVIAELLRNMGKPPSVFDAGNIFSSVGNYQTSEIDLTAKKLKSMVTGGTALPKVYVFSLNSAEIFRFFYTNFYLSTPAPVLIAYALSPNDNALNPIALEKFSAFGQGNTVQVGTGSAGITVFDEIPCAGNKYIHIFGFVINGAADVFAQMVLDIIDNWMTYSLVK